ncbi:unnamed protein product [Moneuplotes crassus]|uniref:FAD-binding PCMH-type domain-containing protein n=1 Tax=Euplotes crassus TaxID=5936 RepID=A0AAD1UBE0_EUPCR|nr:unnamed protein product [Moneuplotes crassus]
MFRLKNYKFFSSFKRRTLFRGAILASIYGVHQLTKKRGFDSLEDEMKLIFPSISQDNKRVEINNYYQLESLVNSAYRNDVLMKISKIQDTTRENLGISNTVEEEKPKRRRRFKKYDPDAVEIDITGLSAIKKIHPEDRICVVEGGIQVSDLNEALKEHGLMFPTPLFPHKTIMEVINENILLSDSYKSGAVKNHIEDINLMTPSSKLVKTGNLTGDDFCYGYHIKDIIVGSHYSLGFITECTLKLREIRPYGLLVTVQLDSDSEKDYLNLLRNIRHYDGYENIIDSIRLYNGSTFVNPAGKDIDGNKKLIAFYSYTNSEEKQAKVLQDLEKLISKEISGSYTHNVIKFDYDDYKYTNLTKPEEWRSYHLDCYLPITKVPEILDLDMPAIRTKFEKGKPQEVIRESHKAFENTKYELHLINNAALLRIFLDCDFHADGKSTEGKVVAPKHFSSSWIDRVTSSVLFKKGVIYAKKEVLDDADPNLVTRIIGTESEQIQKEIKRIFDDKDLLERKSLFDASHPSLTQRIKDIHPIYNYILSKFL